MDVVNNKGPVTNQARGDVNIGDQHNYYLERLETPPSPSTSIPFPRDPDFIEHGSILDQLKKKYTSPASRAALVGLGGVGKSQFAIEYGYRARDRSPETWVFWIHAGSAARFEQSYRDIADRVKILGRQDPKVNIFKLVCDWLQDGKRKQWLLILDNVDDAGFLVESRESRLGIQESVLDARGSQPLASYLPWSENGQVLLTTRSRSAALKLVEERDIIAVEPMAKSQALALFEKKLGAMDEGNHVAELAEALEFMPLAIVQAAAYVSQRAPRYSVQRYLEDYRKSDHKKTSLLNYKGGQLRRDWEANNSIIITWQISFEYIHQTRPSAGNLLSLMSFFDRQGIPEALVRKRAESGNSYESQEERDKYNGREEEEEKDNKDDISQPSEDDGFEDDVQTLRDYSFLSVGVDRTFEMHALVQLATRKWLEANKQLEQWKEYYIKNLSAEFPTGEYENWTYCQALFPHTKSTVIQRPQAEGSLREWASLLYNAAWYAWKKGSITEAVELSEIAMKERKKMLGQEHEETLSSMGMVGLAYNLGGRWKEAEELQVQVMETRKRVLGQEHRDTLASMNNLASTYRNQGRWKEAEELQVQVMETTKRVLGYEHPDTLTSIANLASTFWNQGRWKEAEELEVQVMETRKRVQGQEHPASLTSMANLASTYRDQGRWKEAEELQVQVMETMKRVLGYEHPDTLTSMNNLAFTWKRQGRNPEAINLMDKNIHLLTRILGADHPRTLSSFAALTEWQKQKLKTSSSAVNDPAIEGEQG